MSVLSALAALSTLAACMALTLRNLAFYTLLGVWSVCTALLVLPLCAVSALCKGEPLRVGVRRANHLYGRGWRYCIRPWARVELLDMELCNFPRPCIVVANHQSFFDIHCLAGVPNGNIVFTVRSWPFRIPFYGFFMRLGDYINVEELNAAAVLEHIRRDAAEGAAIVFFPEGHRQRADGIGRFHAGAFSAAVAAGVPVVPVCIKGSGAVLPPGTPWINTGHIRVRALPAVFPAAFSGHGDAASGLLRKHVQRSLRECFSTL